MVAVSSKSDVLLYGSLRCGKSGFYQEALAERGVKFVFRDVEASMEAEVELRQIYGGVPGAEKKFPTLLIGSKKLRNPSLRDLDRVLAHAGIYNPGVLHESHANRFVKFMFPTDAFISYSEVDNDLTLTHIQIPSECRGKGLGRALALETFPLVRKLGRRSRITCPFLRHIARSSEEWRMFFGIQS